MINLDRRPVDAISELGVFSPNSSKGIHQWRTEVKGQRTLRESLYRHVVHLDAKLRDAPDALVFPDAYSLLFWIWTFQLFDQLYTGAPGEVWKKYFYRGEAKDYGATRFQPKIGRPDTPKNVRDASIPPRARALLREHHFPQETPTFSSSTAGTRRD